MTLLSIIGVLFCATRLHRAGITLMLFCGPGLVMLSRAAEPIKDATGFSSAAILVAWALLLIALAIPLWRLRLGERLQHAPQLNLLREAAQPRWSELAATMRAQTASFAQMAMDYASL